MSSTSSGASTDVDVRRGDLVSSTFHDAHNEPFQLLGRVHARLPCLTSVVDPPALYVVRLLLDMPQFRTGAGPALVGARVLAALRHRHGPFVWGSYPDDGVVVLVADDSMTLAVRGAGVDVMRRHGACPRCGDLGAWRSLGLVCRFHGLYL